MTQILIYPQLQIFPHFKRRCELCHRYVSRLQTKKGPGSSPVSHRHHNALVRSFPTWATDVLFEIVTVYVRLFVCMYVCIYIHTHKHTKRFVYITHTHINREIAQRSTPKLHQSNPTSVHHEMMKFQISLNQSRSVLKTNNTLSTKVEEEEMSYFKYCS